LGFADDACNVFEGGGVEGGVVDGDVGGGDLAVGDVGDFGGVALFDFDFRASCLSQKWTGGGDVEGNAMLVGEDGYP
jgi:hypothetical protein